MLRVIIVLGLVATSLTYTLKSDWSPSKVEAEDYSWDEANGYEECKDWQKEGDWSDETNDWESNDFDGDEESYNAMNKGEQYRFDSDEKDEGSSGLRDDGWPKPKPLDKICAEYECPKMEKLNISGCGFEARKVFGANWTQTSIDISNMESGIQNAFWRLFKYISGANDQGVKIAMTVPVLYTWEFDEKYQLTSGNMHFYLPSAFQSNPPVPTDNQVSVVAWSDAVVYDRAFGGSYRSAKFYKKQFMILWKALKKEDITIYPYMSITAGYTRPGFGRQRNEVMFVDNGSM